MVRIPRTLDSETLYLPELKALIGKTVEITVREEIAPNARSAAEAWDIAIEAASEIHNYDFDAYSSQRDYDLHHAKDHQP